MQVKKISPTDKLIYWLLNIATLGAAYFLKLIILKAITEAFQNNEQK